MCFLLCYHLLPVTSIFPSPGTPHSLAAVTSSPSWLTFILSSLFTWFFSSQERSRRMNYLALHPFHYLQCWNTITEKYFETNYPAAQSCNICQNDTGDVKIWHFFFNSFKLNSLTWNLWYLRFWPFSYIFVSRWPISTKKKRKQLKYI